MNDNETIFRQDAIRILSSLYPQVDPFELDRNLYFPIKRCMQLQPGLCAGFPECLCGQEALLRTGIDPDKLPARPLNPQTARASFQLIQGSGPKPKDTPDPDRGPEPPATAMQHPTPPLFTNAMAKRKVPEED